jgi:hypothetical protein
MLCLILGGILIADGSLFVWKRDIIEPRVRAAFPNLNAGGLATAEILCGMFLILL